MYRRRIMSRGLGYAFCRSARRRRDRSLKAAFLEYIYYRVYYRRLSCSRSACDDRNSHLQRCLHRMLLIFRKVYPCRVLGPAYQAVYAACDRFQLRIVYCRKALAHVLFSQIVRRQKDCIAPVELLDIYIAFERHVYKLFLDQLDRQIQELPRLFAQHVLRQECIALSCKV